MSAVGVRPGKDDPDHARSVRVGGCFEQHVDRRPRELDVLVDRKRERASLHQQVVVRRCDVDVAGLDRHLVLDVEHGSLAFVPQELCEHLGWGVAVAMLCDRDRKVELWREVTEHAPDRVQPAPRRADTDEVVHQSIFR